MTDYSEDATPEIVKRLMRDEPRLRYFRTHQRGIGAGLKTGLERTQKTIVMFYPIDLAWSLDTIERSFDALEAGAGVVIGSRWCPGASTRRPKSRDLSSRTYNRLVRLFLGLRLDDTQGTFAIRRKDLEPLQGRLVSPSPFLQTELLFHADAARLRIVEIPCNVVETREHSNVSLVRDGSRMMAKLVSFWWTTRVMRKAEPPSS